VGNQFLQSIGEENTHGKANQRDRGAGFGTREKLPRRKVRHTRKTAKKKSDKRKKNGEKKIKRKKNEKEGKRKKKEETETEKKGTDSEKKIKRKK
jgi:hypothetical protein